MSKQELFETYRIDRTPAALEAVVRACRPLVASVCRRYLRRPEDVDDAVQETFLKLARGAESVRCDMEPWLTATAYKTSIDLIRRATRERRRRAAAARPVGTAADPTTAEQYLVHAAVRARLADALLMLDEDARELIVARFYRRTPLRVIAGARGVSVATLSRRTTAAVAALAGILRDMGIDRLDERTLAAHFGDPARLTAQLEAVGGVSDELHFAPDWRLPLFAPAGPQAVGPGGPLWPGWTRRIRVGVLASYLSSITPGSYKGIRHDVEVQVRTTQYLADPALQLVAVAEPGTTGRGPIERVMRDYELTGGLIDATDVEGLRTLDVILLGTVFAIDPAVAAAFAQAVRSGVGLLNEWWTGTIGPADSDPNVRALLLADSPVLAFHIEPHCSGPFPLPGVVRQPHPLLPGLRAGDRVPVAACGPLYRPTAGARVLIEKEPIVEPDRHRIPGLGAARMPAYVVGQLGRGRVVAALVAMLHGTFARHLDVGPSEYLTKLMAWLAEPRREGA